MGNINPRVDLAFKKIFGVEENKDLTISLINSIISAEDQVADITLLNPYNPQNFKTDKLSILDIKAKGHNGKLFNIEIQITDEADYNKRALYYWGKLYTEQLQTGKEYSTLSKAIGIHILNFTSIPKSDKYHNVFRIAEKTTGVTYFEDLELHTIELSKFTGSPLDEPKEDRFQKDYPQRELANLIMKVQNSLDLWAAFLTRNDLLNKDNLPKELADANLKKALTVLDVMNLSDIERDAYEDRLKWLRIEENTLMNYEKKGMAKGELKAKREIALKMLAKNLDAETILEYSGLTSEELAVLKAML